MSEESLLGGAGELGIVDLLREFDGRSVEPFREALELLPEAPEVLELLVDLAGEDEASLRVGATWLLKARLESGAPTTSSVRRGIIELLCESGEAESGQAGSGQVEAGLAEAQLHLLQSLPHLEIDEHSRRKLRLRLPALLASKNVFVRAWAYNAFAVLGQTSRADRARALELFDALPGDEKASVKARVRHARRSLGDSI